MLRHTTINKRCQMKWHAVIDLHPTDHYSGLISEESKVLFKHKLENNMTEALRVLEP